MEFLFWLSKKVQSLWSFRQTGSVGASGDIRAHDIVTGAQVNHIINIYRASGGRLDEKKYRIALEHYLAWVRSHTGKVVLRGIQREGRQVIELPIHQVYVPLVAIASTEDRDELKRDLAARLDAQSGEAASSISFPIKSTKKLSTRELLGVGRLLAVVGGPGCGKTTILQHIAWTLSEALTTGNTTLVLEQLGLTGKLPLPIYIPLSLYANHRRRFSEHVDPRQRQLATFINHYILERQAGLRLPPDFFAQLLDEGQHIILLLDGLDEVPNMEERALVTQAVQDLTYGRERVRCIITCRSQAYRGKAVLGSGFRAVQILPLSLKQVFDLIYYAYKSIFPAEEEKPEREYYTTNLVDSVQQLESKQTTNLSEDSESRFVTTPLLVRMVLIVQFNLRQLPDQRAELYMQVIDALITSAYNPDEVVAQQLAQLGGEWRRRRDIFQYLAFNIHCRGINDGPEIEEKEMINLIQDYLKKSRYKSSIAAEEVAKSFISINRQRSNLLEEQSGLYRFSHLCFQEFLTARYLAEIIRDVDGIAEFIERENRVSDPWWREPILLTIGYLNITAPDTAIRLIHRLAHVQDGESFGTFKALAATELAATAFLEWGGDDTTRRTLAQSLGDLFAFPSLVGEISSTVFTKRLTAGQVLAKLGDLRPGVGKIGVLEKNEAVPDILFCKTPEGEFLMGSDPEKDSLIFSQELPQHVSTIIQEPFFISRYPTTNAQFQCFVDADDGYCNDKNWTQDGLRWRGNRSSPQRSSGVFNLSNHPVVWVTWYECWAFCQWITEKIKAIGKINVWSEGLYRETRFTEIEIRLPSEVEWEKAARGANARLYPWGNSCEIELRSRSAQEPPHTNAVGIFPNEESPYGLLDMCGNVWEWCQNTWGWDYRNKFNDIFNEPSGATKRVVRGGGFANNSRLLRAACRFGNVPDFKLDDLGFRVVAKIKRLEE